MASDTRYWRDRSALPGAAIIAMAAGLLMQSLPAGAVEGGSGAYLLGSRDMMAGVVPPPGHYANLDVIHIGGSVEKVAIGGIALTNAEIDAWIAKPGVTFVAPAPAAGGRMALNIQLPMASVNMDFTGVLGGLIAGTLSDEQIGMGDPSVTPLIGWDAGRWHANLSLPVYVPIGNYDTASIEPGRPPRVDVVSIGKNKWAVDPTLAVTWLDPRSGFELSGAAGITFSAINAATDYQTAPELHVEATIGQHFGNGAALAMTGYWYQQLANDSGAGAERFEAVTRAESLQARVFGIGPVLNWNTSLAGRPLAFEAKYLHEFGAKRRFESDIVWGSVVFGF